MGGEIYAQLFQFAGHGARVCITGFQTIGNQNNRGFVFFVFQCFRGLFDRRRQWCFAFGRQGLQCGTKCGGIHRAGGDNLFDITAITFAAMPVGNQAQIIAFAPILQDRIKNRSGNGDFRLAVYLPPHTARRIKNQNGLGGRGFGKGDRTTEKTDECKETDDENGCPHSNFPKLVPVGLYQIFGKNSI